MSVSLAKHVPSTIATVPTVVHIASGSSMPVVNEVLANNHLESFTHVLRGMNKGIYGVESRVSLKKPVVSQWQDNHPVVFDTIVQKESKYNARMTNILRNNDLEALQVFFWAQSSGLATIH